ncbi:hypothetical protein Mal4_06800 [Maioricimonas rarisocia]|uniref:Uncharacterized protein n=2 Tax=Maioricimonas rarisocia TaxID=2528026 RepID=A0A517Z1P2_9PLAN|nr:hypothetical protein Mal4_06800 [Maioricimonas rarisocia]
MASAGNSRDCRCGGLVSAVLIAIVVLGVAAVASRVGTAESSGAERSVHFFGSITQVETALFYFYSTIAQALAATLALVLVLVVPRLDNTAQKLIALRDEERKIFQTALAGHDAGEARGSCQDESDQR